MKNPILSIILLTFLILGCEKEKTDNLVNDTSLSGDLKKSAEGFLSLKSTQQIYTDKNNNEYLSIVFDIDKTSSVYGIFMEKDKKYYIAVSGSNSYDLEFLLLKSNYDTLFTGEFVMTENPRKYMAWTSSVTDTFYIKIRYEGDINFQTIEYQITFEDLTNKILEFNNLILKCSGDWFIRDNGILGLACHQTGTTKWAKIENDSLYNYDFSYKVTSNTGKPDSYIGIICYGASTIFDMENVPASCYKFDILGPASWRKSIWFEEGGVGFEYGNTTVNLNIGLGNWNKIGLITYGDSISCSVNDENVTRFRNLNFMENGLYITAEDTKKDTMYFKDIALIR